jgi:predicted dehydrogenase
MSNDTIRVGLIGAGANTKLQHIPGFQAIDGVEIVSVANRSRESGQRIADEYGIPSVYDSWTDLIEAPDTDAICIGTWPYMHRAMVLAALDNDKHVLTEARMAMNASEAHEMLDASREKSGLVTQIVPGPGTLWVDTTIKDLIAAGYLGDILSADLVSQDGFIDRDSSLHWRNNRDLSGFNTMQLGIWYESIVRWIGPATSVRAITRVNVRSRNDEGGSRRQIAVPDLVEVICEMASGPVMHMRISAVSGLAPADAVWMFGTEGTLHLDAGANGLYGGRKGDGELSEMLISAEKLGGWRVEEEFISAIRGLEPVTHTTFEDGVRYMEFTEAVVRSSQSGETVYLPL